MRFNSLDAWLAWQETCHPREIDLGLERVRQVAQRLNLLSPPATVITVAGTNGKGSCVTTLESILTAQGHVVGAYTSPHLLRYNERIRLNGSPVEDRPICEAFAAIDEARGDISLSYFEFGTLAAFWLFQRFRADYWLLEVGMGGRLDATNILDADVAVVTSIAIDHQQWLGNDRETIGREKAGIFRPGRPVVCADRDAPTSVIAHAQSLGCPLLLVGEAFDWQSSETEPGWQVLLSQPNQQQTLLLPLPQLPAASVAAALQVLVLLEQLPSEEELVDLIRSLQLPGRFQVLRHNHTALYLDVAHNPAAAAYLAQRLETRNIKNVAVVVAIMADKDINACLQPLLPYVRHWCVAALPDMPRAAPPEMVEGELVQLGVAPDAVTRFESVATALHHVEEKGLLAAWGCQALLITGSFYTVAAALQAVGE